jgi:hypothetical protein
MMARKINDPDSPILEAMPMIKGNNLTVPADKPEIKEIK